MRTRLTTGAVLAAAVALAGSALAAPSLTIDSVSVSGGTATAAGAVAFGEAGDGSVGGTPTTAAPDGRVFAPAGVDLKGAGITPSADGKALTFTWKVAGLPASPPPEVTRYTWSFAVGEKTFQLQAKRSNTASTTVLDEPAGHVTSAASGAFQLRGNCTANYMGTPVASCPHLKFLAGAFDSATSEVRMVVPLADIGAGPGAVLTPIETAGMSISAAYQAAVSNTTISTFINGWNPYFTAPVVQLATGFAGDEDQSGLAYTTAAVADGAFSGTTEVLEDADALVARACVATTCTYTEKAL